ncbi:MAG: hypothetical protein NTW21_30865, partial [Verrucomicrobia bacterium]|nr:hypothetical protein [Verrucomicrobiota bacterium]
MKIMSIIKPIGNTLKHLALAVAVGVGLGAGSAHAAISFGPTGTATETFDAVPAASEWASVVLPNGGGSGQATSPATLDTFINTLAASGITTTLGSRTTDPAGSTTTLGQWQSTALRLTSRAGTSPATVFKATLQNDSGSDLHEFNLSFTLYGSAAANEDPGLAGYAVYYSLTGSAGDWHRSGVYGTLGAVTANNVALNSAWVSGTTLYVLWADDNGVPGGDGWWGFDDVSFTKSSPAADIQSFGIPGYPAVITGTSIAMSVPYGTPVTALAPTYTTTYGATWASGFESGSTHNFSSPVHYIITSSDSAITNDYTVTATVVPVITETDHTANFTSGSDGYQANVPATTANLLADPGTTLALSGGAPATPPNGGGGTSLSWSALTDGSYGLVPPTGGGGPGEVAISSNWILTYTLAEDYDLSSIDVFTGWGDGGRDNPNVTVKYSSDGTTFSTLKTVSFSGTGNSTWGHLDIAGLTTKAIQFAFGAQENGYVGYTELAVQGQPSSPQAKIVAFGPGAVINQTALTIDWTVPYGTPVATLTPSYTLSLGATCPRPNPDTTGDFSTTTPVHYIVTNSINTLTNDYAVTVHVTPASPACDMLTFGPGAVINQGAQTIQWKVPPGTDLATLAPTYTVSQFATCPQPNPGIPTPNFSEGPVPYIVHAQDGTTKEYTVTVEFSPLPVWGGLACWYDAGVGVSTNGSGGVTAWDDQSGNGHQATPGGGAATYVASDTQIARPAVHLRSGGFMNCALSMTAGGAQKVKEQYVVLRSGDGKTTWSGGSFLGRMSNDFLTVRASS